MRGSVADTRPFAPFEWLLAARYLRARRKEGFISVIAGFSFLGILLGVATLIIVMSVMNGFRKELFNKILGLNGHVIVTKVAVGFDDYEEAARRISAIAGVKHALPLIEANQTEIDVFDFTDDDNDGCGLTVTQTALHIQVAEGLRASSISSSPVRRRRSTTSIAVAPSSGSSWTRPVPSSPPTHRRRTA